RVLWGSLIQTSKLAALTAISGLLPVCDRSVGLCWEQRRQLALDSQFLPSDAGLPLRCGPLQRPRAVDSKASAGRYLYCRSHLHPWAEYCIASQSSQASAPIPRFLSVDPASAMKASSIPELCPRSASADCAACTARLPHSQHLSRVSCRCCEIESRQ